MCDIMSIIPINNILNTKSLFRLPRNQTGPRCCTVQFCQLGTCQSTFQSVFKWSGKLYRVKLSTVFYCAQSSPVKNLTRPKLESETQSAMRLTTIFLVVLNLYLALTGNKVYFTDGFICCKGIFHQGIIRRVENLEGWSEVIKNSCAKSFVDDLVLSQDEQNFPSTLTGISLKSKCAYKSQIVYMYFQLTQRSSKLLGFIFKTGDSPLENHFFSTFQILLEPRCQRGSINGT